MGKTSKEGGRTRPRGSVRVSDRGDQGKALIENVQRVLRVTEASLYQHHDMHNESSIPPNQRTLGMETDLEHSDGLLARVTEGKGGGVGGDDDKGARCNDSIIREKEAHSISEEGSYERKNSI